jgi:hypothetical protein
VLARSGFHAIVFLSLLGQPAFAQAPQPDQAPTPDEVRQDSGRSLRLGTVPDTAPPESVEGTKTRPKLELSIDPGQWCPTCPGATGARAPVNRNAPSMIRGGLSYAPSAASRISVGLLGYRNGRLPAYMLLPIASQSAVDIAPSAALTDVSNSATQWQLSAGFERAIRRPASGLQLNLFGDVFVPLTTADNEVAPATIPSRALRLGVNFGF